MESEREVEWDGEWTGTGVGHGGRRVGLREMERRIKSGQRRGESGEWKVEYLSHAFYAFCSASLTRLSMEIRCHACAFGLVASIRLSLWSSQHASNWKTREYHWSWLIIDSNRDLQFC